MPSPHCKIADVHDNYVRPKILQEGTFTHILHVKNKLTKEDEYTHSILEGCFEVESNEVRPRNIRLRHNYQY